MCTETSTPETWWSQTAATRSSTGPTPCIAHPFTDLATYLHMLGPPSTDVAVLDLLRDRYLQGWNDLMPYDAAAVTLFERTEPVAALHTRSATRRS
ncbi:MAG TPA: hypothetical protein VFF07_03815 [Actinomycetota bacterium]|nr:hypothetical protein [Actinomycetota bacterium]